ncbi:MAG: DUF4417 domain-containing protein [Selenomonadaceae bacterium]|nr:DUF4417 domain-containing protein [Selenomonadaceae bacterium]
MRKPEDFFDDLLRFPAIVTPDNSLYRDSPLIAQIANVYRSRAIGHYLQKNGAYVITNVRWSDERSYTTDYLPEKFAFLGAPKNSIVSIGTYGCIRGKENKYFFRAGLEAMLDELTPEVVLSKKFPRHAARIFLFNLPRNILPHRAEIPARISAAPISRPKPASAHAKFPNPPMPCVFDKIPRPNSRFSISASPSATFPRTISCKARAPPTKPPNLPPTAPSGDFSATKPRIGLRVPNLSLVPFPRTNIATFSAPTA